MTARETINQLHAQGFKLVFWPQKGDQKGPLEKDWPRRPYLPADYKDGHRVGLLLGTELSPGKFAHDVDIDWTAGYNIAAAFLPRTDFVYGRASKKVSHCIYTLSEAIPTFQYKDPIDGVTLIEIRGTKDDGSVGFQSMAPPSVWSKDGKLEPLEFRAFKSPAHFESTTHFTQRITLAAIGMLLAKRFGHNGFGHDVRLAWAGFLLRASIAPEDLVTMGEAISIYCNNREVVDVRTVVESTVAGLAANNKKVKGGPALAKLLGSGDVGKKIIEVINTWLGRDSDFIRTPDGLIVKDNQHNVRRAIQLVGLELSYHEFAERMLVSVDNKPVVPLDDRIMNAAWLKIDRECRFRPSFAFFEAVLTDSAYDVCFHPVRDYLASLRWDQTPRIDHWLSRYGGADDSDYLHAVSSIVLIAAVRRIMQPGCKYDEMLMLESAQGFSKSSALRSLCPKDEWFSDDLPLNVDAKEIIERTLGKWIIEASDLAGHRKADRDHLKSMLSRQTDGPARMAYAHIPVERPRQFIIIGTTNSAEYLADPTGSRRFWPVKVKRFNLEQLIADRDQLWAEAAVREASGASIRLPEALWDVAGEHQELRRNADAWESVLHSAILKTPASGDGKVRIATDELWSALGIPLERRDRSASIRISDIMQRLGLKRTTVRRDDDSVGQGYVAEAETTLQLERRAVARSQEDVPF